MMDQQTIHILQFLGALVPATALLGLLVYTRCKHAGVSRRRTIVAIVSVCGALLGAGATVMVASQQLDAAPLDVAIGSGEGGMPTASVHTIDWTGPQVIVIAIAAAIVVALWILAIRSVCSLPQPSFESDHGLDTLNRIQAVADEDADDGHSMEGNGDGPAEIDTPEAGDAD